MTKCNTKTMNKMVELLKTRGHDLTQEDVEFLRDKEVVSKCKWTKLSYQFKDKNGNYFRPSFSFKSVVRGTKKVDTETMKMVKDEIRKLVEKFGEEITTDLSIPTSVKSVSS